MRELIGLECKICKRRNYYSTKNKRKHPEKFLINKFCRFCRKYTEHKEVKA